MSDFPENKQEVELETELEPEFDEESTVFSAPAEHKRKSAMGGDKRRLLSIIAAVLSVSILVGGTIAVIKIIPKFKEDEVVLPEADIFSETEVVSNFLPVSAGNSDPTVAPTVKKITVKNKNGEFVLLSKEAIAGNVNSMYWTLEGVDYSKLSSTQLNSIVSAAGNITAINAVNKSTDECGFATPRVKCTVEKSDNTSYTLLVGNEAPGGLGYYIALEGADEVYIARETAFEKFEFTLLELSDTSAIPKVTFSSDTTNNVEDDGSYAYFDSLTISGKHYPETITILNNKSESKTAKILPYLVSTPSERYANAESLAGVVNLFSKSTSVTGNCALDVNEDTLKRFGLDDPDVVVSMTINGETKSFKFSKIEDEEGDYCAIVYDGATMIRKGDISAFDFLTNTTESYYYKSPFMIAINDISNLTIKNSENTFRFDIDNHGGTATTNNMYSATINGKDVSKGFQAYYSDFTCIQYNSFEITEVSASPDATITFNYVDGGKSEIEIYLVSATEYQCRVDGMNMGRLPSSEYNKIMKNFEIIADGGNVMP